jgi:hypothetical protein
MPMLYVCGDKPGLGTEWVLARNESYSSLKREVMIVCGEQAFLCALRDHENLNKIIGRGYHTRGAEMVSDKDRPSSQYITTIRRVQIILCTKVFINKYSHDTIKS